MAEVKAPPSRMQKMRLAARIDRPELVIGIPGAAEDHNAHAWVEIEGAEVGPPPGSGNHLEMARFR